MKISLDRINKFLKSEEKDISQISHEYKNGLNLKFSISNFIYFFQLIYFDKMKLFHLKKSH